MQYNTFIVIFSSRFVSGGSCLVNCNPCLLMYKCPIFLFFYLSRCFLISFFMRPCQVFRKPGLIDLRRLAVLGMKISACKYMSSSVFKVCAKMLFTTFSSYCGPRGTFHIPVFFLVPLIIYSPLFWMDIDRISSVMMYPSSHNTPNDINGVVYIFGKMLICLASLLRPGS